MRIGLIAPPWVPVPPPQYGGTEEVIDRLARGVVAAGHDVMLWTTGDSECPVPTGHVIERADPSRMGASATELHHVIAGYDALDTWGADLVHDHTSVGPLNALRFPHLPVAATNHNPFTDELLTLYRAVTPHVALVAISRDHAVRAVDLPIAAVIHHGIDLDTFTYGQGAGDDEGAYFVFLGRMAPEKGVHRAAAAAREAGVRLVIAAKMVDLAEQEYFEKEVEPLLDHDVLYVGEVPLAEKVALLRGAAGLVFPIRWHEPFGLVMIEALACGTPVLAFAEGAAPEVVDHGETGYLCADESDLARRMGQVHQIDRRCCRRAAARRFSTAPMVDAHLALYRTLIDQRVRAT